MVTKFVENTANNSQNSAPVTKIQGIAKNSYIAYADDADGTGFIYPKTTAEFDDTKTHIAILNTYEIIENPQASDFEDLWFPVAGGIGPAGPAGTGYTVIASPSTIIIPTDATGGSPDYTNAFANIQVYDNTGSDVTGDYFISYQSDSGISGKSLITASSPKVFTITGVTAATGYQVLELEGGVSHPNLEVKIDFRKINSGEKGDSAINVIASPSSIAIPTDNDGNNPDYSVAYTHVYIYDSEGANITGDFTGGYSSSSAGVTAWDITSGVGYIRVDIDALSSDTGWISVYFSSSDYPYLATRIHCYKVKEGIPGPTGPTVTVSPGDIAIPTAYDGSAANYIQASAHIRVINSEGVNITDDYDAYSIISGPGYSSGTYTDQTGYKLFKINGVSADSGFAEPVMSHPIFDDVRVRVNFHKAKNGFNGENQPDNVYLGLNSSDLMTIRDFAETLIVGDSANKVNQDTGTQTGNIVIADDGPDFSGPMYIRNNKGTFASLAGPQTVASNKYCFIVGYHNSSTARQISNNEQCLVLSESSAYINLNLNCILGYRDDTLGASSEGNTSCLIFGDNFSSDTSTTISGNANSIINVQNPVSTIVFQDNSILVGRYITASGGGASGRLIVGRGHFHDGSSGSYNAIIGHGGKTSYDSEFVIGYSSTDIVDPASFAGSDQTSKVVKRITTTDGATVPALIIKPYSRNKTISIKVIITANLENTHHHRSEYVALLDTSSSSNLQLVGGGAQQIGTTIEDSSFNGSATISLASGNTELRINVTGEAASTYNWLVTVDIDRLSFNS